MNAALRYLLLRSLVNSVRTRLLRLRQPKYLIGAVLGGAYFYFYFYKLLGQNLGSPRPALPPEALTAVWALALFGATLFLSWVLPASRAALAFSEAEMAFLFPAPLSRRALVIHKLLRSQFAMLMLSALMTLITGRFREGPQAWFAMGTLWVALNTLNMHRIGASFALQRLRERGLADWKRRLAFLLAAAALALGIEWTRRSFTVPPAQDTAALLHQLVNNGPLRYLLAPFKIMVAPFVAHDLAGFALAILPALGIMAAHFIWVIAADTSFEEASIAAAQRRATFLTAVQSGGMRITSRSAKSRTPLWRLRPTGFAPLALMWKSALKMGGRRTLAWWSAMFATLAVTAWFVRNHANQQGADGFSIAAVIIGIICYIAVLLSLVLVGQTASGQLRHGMTMMDLLKTYPIPGWKLALGELLGPVIAGTLLQWCALAVGGYLATTLIRDPAAMAGLTVAFCIGGLLLPVFNVGMAILPSVAALMFPGWFKPQDAAQRGIEQTGLRLVMGVGQLLAIVLAMLPPLFFGACAWFASARLGLPLPWQAATSAMTAAFVFALEAALGIAWLGTLYDQYDGSEE